MKNTLIVSGFPDPPPIPFFFNELVLRQLEARGLWGSRVVLSGTLTWLSDIENKKESSGEGNTGAGSGDRSGEGSGE